MVAPLAATEARLGVTNPSEELALRARLGDRQAFGALYERFAPMVHGVLLARVGVREAQDLLQEVFLTALRSIHGLEEPDRIGGWLATIARNRASDRLRSRSGSEEPLDDDASAEPPARDAVDGAAEREEAARALRAIRELPEAYREPLVLRLVEGLTGPEIAERCAMTHGSVRVNLCRGMRLLRERLGVSAEADG